MRIQKDFKRNSSKNVIIIESEEKLSATMIISSFEETTSLPYQTLRHFYNMITTLQCSHENLLKHARECLDILTCSILNVIRIDSENKYLLLKVINIVDNYVLSMNDHKLYNILYDAAEQLSHDRDDYFLDHATSMKNKTCNYTDMSCLDLLDDIHHAVSAMDKLSVLVTVLKSLASTTSLTRLSLESCDNGIDTANDIKFKLKESSEDLITKCLANGYDRNEDFMATSWDEATLVNAEKLVQLLEQLLETDVRGNGHSKWHTESVFVAAMVPDGTWLYNVEGYALATLQTALSSHTKP
jgi:hypothetical protein